MEQGLASGSKNLDFNSHSLTEISYFNSHNSTDILI